MLHNIIKSLVFLTCLVSCADVTPTPQTPRYPTIPTASATTTVSGSTSPTLPSSSGTPTISPSTTLKDRGSESKTSLRNDSLFESLVKPLGDEALRRRAERAKTDPEYSKRVVRELNDGRINFLLYGYGETHEPPATEKAIIGSITIVSYNTKTAQADVISLTHDIRAPSIEAEAPEVRGKVYAQKMDQAYPVGGFRLMRRVLENATGLSMDFQVAFKDVSIQRLIDNVFGGMIIDVPEEFDVHAFYLEGKKYPAAHFSKGRQTFNGQQVIQFIKTVPVAKGYYGKTLEHNVRKHLVFRALLDALSNDSSNTQFWLKASGFLTTEVLNGSIAYDFDIVALGVNNIGNITSRLGTVTSQRPSADAFMPEINKTIYIADPANGDGGVQWVGANAAVNPITQRDLQDGKYMTPDMTIPLDANPYGDLVTGYWPSVRSIVRIKLMAASSGSNP